MNSALSKSEGFQGTLSNIQLIDLLQMTCLSRISMNIKVEGEGKEGLIQIFNGNIVHAESGQVKGEEAFFEIMSWKGGNFQTFSMTDVPTPTIEKNWEFLLIEATKMQDETSKSGRAYQTDDSLLKILIVDDSKLICKKMQEMIESDPQLKVIGTAQNGKEALKKISKLDPDLITLDINMPVMSGGTALKHIMIQSPCPVLIISSIEEKDMSKVMDFIRLGAVDFIPKPKPDDNVESQREKLISKIKLAAKANVHKFKRCKLSPQNKKEQAVDHPSLSSGDRSIIIVAGMGGFAECIKIIPNLNAYSCSIILALWHNDLFLGSFAEFLNGYTEINIVPVRKGGKQRLLKNCCYLCSLEREIILTKDNNSIELIPDEEDKGWESSLNTFVHSVCEIFTQASQLVWIFLSGEETIPEKSLNTILSRKCHLVVQDPKTSLYPILPESCLKGRSGGVVVPSERIPEALTKLVSG